MTEIYFQMRTKSLKKEEGVSVIYVLSTPHASLLKVGITTKTASERAKQLEQQTASVGEFKELWSYQIPTRISKYIERQVHLILTRQNKHYKKEYFESSLNECIDAIKKVVAEIGADAELKKIKDISDQSQQKYKQKIFEELREQDELITKLFESANRNLLNELRFCFNKFIELQKQEEFNRKNFNFFKSIFSKESKDLYQEKFQLKLKIIQLDFEYVDAKKLFMKTHKLNYVEFNNSIDIVKNCEQHLYKIKKHFGIKQDHWRFRNIGVRQPTKK